jgi:hypothetical protein
MKYRSTFAFFINALALGSAYLFYFQPRLEEKNGETSVEGHEISFPEVRRWVELELVGEPGIGFFFMVSFVGLIGILVRVIDPDERNYIILKDMKSDVEMTSYT